MNKSSTWPELFIGVTGAVGTDLDAVSGLFESKLREMGFHTEIVVLSCLLGTIKNLVQKYDGTNEYERITSLMDAGDKLRQKTGIGSMLANMAVVQVNRIRAGNADHNGRIRGHAYILKSLKHPKEVERLRHIYGRDFWLASVYSPRSTRLKNLKARLGNHNDVEDRVKELINRDEYGNRGGFGQNVRDTFAEGDVFLNMAEKPQESVSRFVDLVFGHPYHTPTVEESGMMVAFNISRASSSLSRQVGASIITRTRDVVAVGINEVPKARGGHYVTGDAGDAREWKIGYDSNTRKKLDALNDLISSMAQNNILSKEAKSITAKDLLDMPGIKNLAFFSPTEYGREVHAEMSALGSLHRTGIRAIGSTMCCTTFPCHVCAKHIIASGIYKVVYIEPYPKSRAEELYKDSITVDEEMTDCKVQFKPFTGVAPKLYGDLFRMQKRKDKDGNRLEWNAGEAVLRYRELRRYNKREMYETEKLSNILAEYGLELKKF